MPQFQVWVLATRVVGVVISPPLHQPLSVADKAMRIQELELDEVTAIWATLLLGWIGPGNLPSQLDFEDLVSFATARLSVADSPPDALLQLAILGPGERSKVASLLEELSAAEGSGMEAAEQVWKVALLRSLLDRIGTDPIYGLIALTEFWEGFGYPADMPHVVQGRDNDVSLCDYYSTDSLDRLVQAHREWIARERDRWKLRMSQVTPPSR